MAVAHPDAPWLLHGSMWLSLFRPGRDRHPSGGAGPVAVAWVDYRDPSPLTYRELLVAHVSTLALAPSHRAGPRLQVEISDIWVDSPASRDGGRALWAIPKDLAELDHRSVRGRTRGTRWAMHAEGAEVARASFRDAAARAPRVPYRFATRQRWPAGHPRAGATVVAPVRGSARALPCRARWEFAPDGPLAALHGLRPLVSLCLEDFALSFG